MPKSLAFVAVAMIALSATPSCRCGDDRPVLDRAREAGVLRVGFANEAPFAWLDDSSGELTGEAPTVARHVVGELGVGDLSGVMVDFGALIPGLQAGRFDVIAAGMYVTPQRCAQVLFSRPTYCVGEAFLVRSGNPLALHSYEDVRDHETARLGVVTGTVEVGYADAIGIPSDRLVRFPDMVAAAEGVRTGRADAFAGTALTVNDLLQRLGDARLERADPFTDPVIDGATVRGCGAFAFRRDDVALRDAFDAVLADWLGSEAHAAAVEGFGFGSVERTVDVTIEQLCGNAE